MKNKSNLLRSLCVGLCALCVMFFSVGCASKVDLDPAGAYHSDAFLYSTDLAITSSYTVLDTFVTWEYTNRALLASTPQVTKAADRIRANAKQWFASAHALRAAYAATPTDANMANLQHVLAIIQAALVEATGYMAIPPPAPLPVAPVTK